MTRTPERAAFCAIAVAALVVQLRFVLSSEPAALLTTWIPDDAFYYLQAAWNAADGRGFSFDGIEPTYGFQPLWAVLLAGVSALAPSKAAVVLGALLLGIGLHGSCGALLFAWFERAGSARGGLVAASVWLLNPDLVRLHATVMESGLVAALTLGSLAAMDRLERAPGRVGALLGLLALARISAVLLLALVALDGARRRVSRRSVLLLLAGAAAVAVPWMIYAQVALGQTLPASMDRKLVSGIAGGARFVADWPGVPDALVVALLPAREQLLFDAPGLIGPTWARLWRLGVQAPAGWALGCWLPIRWSLSAPVLALGWIALAVGQRGPARPRLPTGFPLLLLMAVGNAAANNLLLSQYVEYGYWYRVPEVLAIVAIVGVLADRALGMAPLRLWVVALLGALAVCGLGRSLADLAPKQHDPESRLVARGGWDVARVLGDHLPAGTRVGSWNAGILGWVTEGPVIVNLDGLANRPEYVPVAAQEVLYRHGLAERLALLDWLREHDVDYLVDLHPIGRMDRAFYDVIPADRVTLVLRSTPVDHWSPGRPDHAVMLVRVRHDDAD